MLSKKQILEQLGDTASDISDELISYQEELGLLEEKFARRIVDMLADKLIDASSPELVRSILEAVDAKTLAGLNTEGGISISESLEREIARINAMMDG